MTPDENAIRELPPSAKLVYKSLEWEGKQTQKQLAEETMLSPRTVRYALNELEEVGAVEEELYIPDARQNVYVLREAEAESETPA